MKIWAFGEGPVASADLNGNFSELQAAIATAQDKADDAIPGTAAGTSLATLVGGRLSDSQVNLNVSDGTNVVSGIHTLLVQNSTVNDGGSGVAIVEVTSGGGGGGGGSVRPPLSDFASFNFQTGSGGSGATSAKEAPGGPITIKTGPSTGDQILGLELSMPTTANWFYRVRLRNLIPSVNYAYAGAFLRNSVSGQLTVFVFGTTASHLSVLNFNSPTSYNSLVTDFPMQVGLAEYDMQVHDDGIERIYSISTDGVDLDSSDKTWLRIASTARSAFMIPDRVGFGVDPRDTAGTMAEFGISMHALSFTY